MKEQIKNIIFDFDGVLMNSISLNKEIILEFVPEFSDEDFKALFIGNVYENPLVQQVTKEFGSEFQKIFFERTTKEHFYEFAEELISILSEKYNLFINTSAPASSVKKYLSYIEKQDNFKGILGCEDSFSKVEKFNMILDNFNCKKEECLFVTDSLGDIFEANKVGIDSIGVTWGVHDISTLNRGNPFAIVNDFQELVYNINNKENFKQKEK